MEGLEMPSLRRPDGFRFAIGTWALLPLSDPRCVRVCVCGGALSKSYRASRAKEVGSMAESDLVLMYIPPELQEAKCVSRKRP